MAWILAVDDEEGIRNLIQNALEKDGHRVSVCKNTEVIKDVYKRQESIRWNFCREGKKEKKNQKQTG